MPAVDWAATFLPTVSLAELVMRGTLMYLGIFLLIRLLPRRALGGLGVGDLLMIVLISDAAQNGMANNYQSVTEGVVLVGTILGWAYIIDWLDYRFPHWHLARANPRLLIESGRIIEKNLRRERITHEELSALLRAHGASSPRGISKAYIEGDGQINIIRRASGRTPPPRRSRRASAKSRVGSG